MASLYNISNDIYRIFNSVELNDGEITDEQYDELCIKQEELKEKLDAYVKAVKEFQATADFCKKEKQSINDRQNVYRNRVERLKRAMLDAVQQFGEHGKNNMFIELPTCRLFTKSSKSIEIDEERVNILLSEFERYVRELVNSGIIYTGEDVDLQGILDSINANIIAEQGDSFEPYTLSDLTTLRVGIKTTASIYELFRHHKDALIEYTKNPLSCNINNESSKDDWKTIIELSKKGQVSAPTLATIVTNESLQIK